MRQLLSSGKSNILLDKTFTDKSQVAIPDLVFEHLGCRSIEVLRFASGLSIERIRLCGSQEIIAV